MVDEEDPGVDFRDEGKHIARNYLLLMCFSCASIPRRLSFFSAVVRLSVGDYGDVAITPIRVLFSMPLELH